MCVGSPGGDLCALPVIPSDVDYGALERRQPQGIYRACARNPAFSKKGNIEHHPDVMNGNKNLRKDATTSNLPDRQAPTPKARGGSEMRRINIVAQCGP